MSFIAYKSWLKLFEYSDIPKNIWFEPDKEEFSDELIELVQNAYKKSTKGSFINTKKDVIESDWLAINVDQYVGLDATIYYRKQRQYENWKGIKIQGVGHDGSFKAIGVLLNKLKRLLNEFGIWSEASDTLEKVFYEVNVPYIEDEKIAKKLFPNSDLKFIGDKGRYNRNLNGEIITETIFGKPLLK